MERVGTHHGLAYFVSTLPLLTCRVPMFYPFFLATPTPGLALAGDGFGGRIFISMEVPLESLWSSSSPQMNGVTSQVMQVRVTQLLKLEKPCPN